MSADFKQESSIHTNILMASLCEDWVQSYTMGTWKLSGCKIATEYYYAVSLLMKQSMMEWLHSYSLQIFPSLKPKAEIKIVQLIYCEWLLFPQTTRRAYLICFLKPGLSICLSLVPSGPKCVYAQCKHLNKHRATGKLVVTTWNVPSFFFFSNWPRLSYFVMLLWWVPTPHSTQQVYFTFPAHKPVPI